MAVDPGGASTAKGARLAAFLLPSGSTLVSITTATTTVGDPSPCGLSCPVSVSVSTILRGLPAAASTDNGGCRYDVFGALLSVSIRVATACTRGTYLYGGCIPGLVSVPTASAKARRGDGRVSAIAFGTAVGLQVLPFATAGHAARRGNDWARRFIPNASAACQNVVSPRGRCVPILASIPTGLVAPPVAGPSPCPGLAASATTHAVERGTAAAERLSGYRESAALLGVEGSLWERAGQDDKADATPTAVLEEASLLAVGVEAAPTSRRTAVSTAGRCVVAATSRTGTRSGRLRLGAAVTPSSPQEGQGLQLATPSIASP